MECSSEVWCYVRRKYEVSRISFLLEIWSWRLRFVLSAEELLIWSARISVLFLRVVYFALCWRRVSRVGCEPLCVVSWKANSNTALSKDKSSAGRESIWILRSFEFCLHCRVHVFFKEQKKASFYKWRHFFAISASLFADDLSSSVKKYVRKCIRWVAAIDYGLCTIEASKYWEKRKQIVLLLQMMVTMQHSRIQYFEKMHFVFGSMLLHLALHCTHS